MVLQLAASTDSFPVSTTPNSEAEAVVIVGSDTVVAAATASVVKDIDIVVMMCVMLWPIP